MEVRGSSCSRRYFHGNSSDFFRAINLKNSWSINELIVSNSSSFTNPNLKDKSNAALVSINEPIAVLKYFAKSFFVRPVDPSAMFRVIEVDDLLI